MWESKTLGDLCSFQAGGAFPRSEQGHVSGDYPFIKVSDMTLPANSKRIVEANNWVSIDAAERMRLKLVPAGAVAFAKIGEGLKAERLRQITRATAMDNNMMAAVPKPGKVDERFLLYLIESVNIASWAQGSALPYLSQTVLSEIPVRVPDLPEQRAIAATLGALDDKIESNRRAVEVLQHTAAALFTRWRSDAVPVVASTFGAYADVYGGATPKTTVPDFWGGGLAWTTPTDVTGLSAPYLFETSRTITDKGLQSCTAVMHPAGTIFMTSRATIGAFAINQVPAATNQGFIAVRPKREADRYFLFEEMRSRVDEFLDNANGSTFLEISRGRFKELPLEVPEPEAIAILDEQVGPLHRKAAQLALESDRLTALRDALLPELLSGRVRALTEARP